MRAILAAALAVGLLGTSSTVPTPKWQSIAPGMDLTYVGPGSTDAARIALLRIDVRLWELEVMGSSRTGEHGGHTAKEWSEQHNYVAAINAGMFATDGKTHLGYLRFRDHVNNGGVNNYQSMAAFDPRETGAAGFRIFDLDESRVRMETIRQDYASVVQNLRLLKRPGLNQWGRQERKWSEAALGEDSAGRVLFIFSRTPYSMHDFNRELLAAGVGVVAAQHLEGGPEAQLYVHVGGRELEMFGSYETSFREDDSNGRPWPVPNVLAVRLRSNSHSPQKAREAGHSD